MDVKSQIVAKRAAANRARQLADRLSGDYKIHALVLAAELEIQADVIEDQLVAPALPRGEQFSPEKKPGDVNNLAGRAQ